MLCLAAALAAAAVWSYGQEASPRANLAILINFDVPPPPPVLESMEREVAQIFEPASIRVAWRDLSENDGSELFSHVVVVRVHGACRTLPSSLNELQPLLDDLELASASVRDGKALPFAEVHCDRVSAFLRPWKKAGEAVSLGVAMGRVIAHELYHVLTNTLTHGPGTLSKGAVTSDDLAVRGATFSQD